MAYKSIATETLEMARKLKAAGVSWNKVARVTGIGRDVLQCRLDPEFALKNRVHGGAVTYEPTHKLNEQEVWALLDKVPRDTRGLTARAFGDPLPGRSALDRRRAQ